MSAVDTNSNLILSFDIKQIADSFVHQDHTSFINNLTCSTAICNANLFIHTYQRFNVYWNISL